MEAGRPNRAERNAAVASAAAAQVAQTCPWKQDAETASTVSSRQQSARNTCPWSREEAAPRPPKAMMGGPRSTCPWGAEANDVDSTRLAEAQRRRQKPSPSHAGRAGAGAPKMAASLAEAASQQSQASREIPQAAVAQQAEFTQRLPEHPNMQPDAIAPSAGSVEEEDQDALEQRDLIQQCLAQGLSEPEIMEMLEEWENHKLIQKTQAKMGADLAQPDQAQAPPALGVSGKALAETSSFGVSGTSLSARRQAQAKVKKASFGPSDEEISGVLTQYAKENLTPPESPSEGGLSLAAMRKKAREPSEASYATVDSEKSRAAYLQAKNQADAVKNKNRTSSGIF